MTNDEMKDIKHALYVLLRGQATILNALAVSIDRGAVVPGQDNTAADLQRRAEQTRTYAERFSIMPPDKE